MALSWTILALNQPEVGKLLGREKRLLLALHLGHNISDCTFVMHRIALSKLDSTTSFLYSVHIVSNSDTGDRLLKVSG